MSGTIFDMSLRRWRQFSCPPFGPAGEMNVIPCLSEDYLCTHLPHCKSIWRRKSADCQSQVAVSQSQAYGAVSGADVLPFHKSFASKAIKQSAGCLKVIVRIE